VLLRGDGVPRAKSAALVLVSSPASSRVAQPGAIERTSAEPSVIAAAGAPGTEGSAPTAVKLPQETQSIESQHAAPPGP
jgi:hypothetical protein